MCVSFLPVLAPRTPPPLHTPHYPPTWPLPHCYHYLEEKKKRRRRRRRGRGGGGGRGMVGGVPLFHLLLSCACLFCLPPLTASSACLPVSLCLSASSALSCPPLSPPPSSSLWPLPCLCLLPLSPCPLGYTCTPFLSLNCTNRRVGDMLTRWRRVSRSLS